MASERQQPKRKRRWLRYSLRSFLVVLTIGCLLLGYWVRRAEQQKAAVRWVRQQGGYAFYEHEADEGGVSYTAKPAEPTWLSQIIGVDYLSAVAFVNLRDTPTANIGPLANLNYVKSVYLDGTNVTDVTPLAGQTNLRYLSLYDTPVKDLAPLADLELVDLSVNKTNVADLHPVSRMDKLEWLFLDDTQVTDLSRMALNRRKVVS